MDTANKRSSAINVGQPWRGQLPIPDGSIGSGDRVQTAFMYRGEFEDDGGGGGATFYRYALAFPRRVIYQETV